MVTKNNLNVKSHRQVSKYTKKLVMGAVGAQCLLKQTYSLPIDRPKL